MCPPRSHRLTGASSRWLRAETRAAIVVVFPDYSAARVASLPGAKHDAHRIKAALVGAGIETEAVVDPSRLELSDILRGFAERSASADFAVMYATGHGVEVNGVVYLLPGDYPVSERSSALEHRAICLSLFAQAARARRANLVFYGWLSRRPGLDPEAAVQAGQPTLLPFVAVARVCWRVRSSPQHRSGRGDAGVGAPPDGGGQTFLLQSAGGCCGDAAPARCGGACPRYRRGICDRRGNAERQARHIEHRHWVGLDPQVGSTDLEARST